MNGSTVFRHDKPVIDHVMTTPGEWEIEIEGSVINIGAPMDMDHAAACAQWLRDNWSRLSEIVAEAWVEEES